ncbi:Helix-turn-helix domain-containing protein [Streptomyces indicus]|uniref:Helix-turn-helix domain-containing protein n=1 Tax=Streptomyces indicus TaxID=417292 RepID=A0A1G9D9C9_9ACTN|nr:Helix-turn-helix domain-containing protein [Streptomyces indicus]
MEPDVRRQEPASEPEARREAIATEPEARRQELADFLRSRRERITPEQVGLPRGARRRTPGLRREEVAALSAVGVTWYTWLEQARPIQVSPQVLDALARALLMDPTERHHLFALAGSADPAPGTRCPTLSDELLGLLEQLEPVPACIQNSRYDILAYNRTYARLFCDLDALPPEDRNCVLLTYTHPEWRASLGDLDETKRIMAAKLRAAMAEHLAEPAWKALLARLKRSEEFCEVWERHEVVGVASKTKRVLNTHVGELRLNHTNLWLTPDSGARMVTYYPADEQSRARLEQLYAPAPSAAG